MTTLNAIAAAKRFQKEVDALIETKEKAIYCSDENQTF
jgi:hypothetical protein